MPRVRITRSASADLEAIQGYGLAEFGAGAVRAFMQDFDRILARLEIHPLTGRAMPEYGRAVRSCLHSPYRVLYRHEGGVVSILRVLHAAQRARPIDELPE